MWFIKNIWWKIFFFSASQEQVLHFLKINKLCALLKRWLLDLGRKMIYTNDLLWRLYDYVMWCVIVYLWLVRHLLSSLRGLNLNMLWRGILFCVSVEPALNMSVHVYRGVCLLRTALKPYGTCTIAFAVLPASDGISQASIL